MLFSGSDVQTAFPEMSVTLPWVGKGGDKVAFQAAREAESLALKILIDPVPDEDTDDPAQQQATERFRREMLGMAMTQCPHVIRAVDEPQLRRIAETNHIWYTEPFLEGGTLYSILKTGRLTPEAAHDLARCLFIAVDAMWGSTPQFVHRDIKPKNIGYLANGTPVLIDLGIALFTELSGITSSSIVGPGSRGYGAPEMYEIKRTATIDFRTDLFQIGIVLVEALTGTHPFIGSPDYWHSLNNFDPATLDGFEMTDGLRRTIPRLLAAHPSRRFRTVDMALNSLDGTD